MARVGRVSGDDQQERLDNGLSRLPCIRLQLDLGVLMQPDTILQLDLLELSRCELTGIKILLGRDGRLFDKPISHSSGQRIVVNDVLELHRTTTGFHERCSGKFQTEHRL
jgi:hypothetical protein